MTTAELLSPRRLVLIEQAREHATRTVLDALPHETGGLLLGWHEGHAVVVARVVTVADPRAGSHHYVRNHARAQRALDEFLATSDDRRIGYVGEWHSHPAPQPPSQIDYASLRAVVREATGPVALIVFAANSDKSLTPHGAIASRAGHRVSIDDLPVKTRGRASTAST